MSGIYIHIPFCKQACHYCDFHFAISLEKKNDFLQALLGEINLQKNFFWVSKNIDSKTASDQITNKKSQIKTIYFGGGTPSLLSSEEIKEILDEISKFHDVSEDAEITLEANPDDLTKEKLESLKAAGINRLSIGIQSFSEDDLKFMNRAHNSQQAIESVKLAQEVGFSNITIDLIYGTPTLSNEQWIKNLQIAFSLNVPHLSCYSLTVEPKTALAQFIKKGTVPPVDDAKSSEQFEMLMRLAPENDFEQYEISNFAKEKKYSIHNSNYWKNEKYLGLGPSAHSYNGTSRQWNIANNAIYIQSLQSNKIPFEIEVLTKTQRYNEYILTSLRTMWGCSLEMISSEFGEKFVDSFSKSVNQFLDNGWIKENESAYTLTKEGKFFADKISAELFIAPGFLSDEENE